MKTNSLITILSIMIIMLTVGCEDQANTKQDRLTIFNENIQLKGQLTQSADQIRLLNEKIGNLQAQIEQLNETNLALDNKLNKGASAQLDILKFYIQENKQLKAKLQQVPPEMKQPGEEAQLPK